MIGKTISHYKILEKLGEGGMGIVYKAEDTKLDRTVALKFLAPHVLGGNEEQSRLIREAKSAAALNHPNICTIYEIDKAEGRTFIAMECVEGQSLKAKMESGPMALDEAVDIAVQIAGGLGQAHAKGIIHRDIKPTNIIVTAEGQAKIMDFGIAKSPGQTKLTKAGTTLGTVSYMSPEQARGVQIDGRTDIWSLGVLLYEMVTGRLPFQSDYEQAVVYSILNEAPEPITALCAGIPPELERAVNRALEKDREKRYQRAEDLLRDLKNLREGLAQGGVVRRAFGNSFRRFLLPVAALLVIGIGLVLGGRIRIARQPPAEGAENSLAIMYFDNLADLSDTGRLGEVATNLLITDLSESRHVQVVSSQRLYDILKLLGKEGTKVIGRDVASQVAMKANAKWMLTGSILQIEPQIILTAQLTDVGSGSAIASQRITGKVGEKIFSIVDALTLEIKHDLSLPTGALEEPDRSVADVTTHSSEAYRHYLEGLDWLNKMYFEEAEASFEKAISADSTFAMAYFQLAYVYVTDNRLGAHEALAKAVEYSDKASQKERHYIRAMEAGFVGDVDTAVEELQKIVEQYPHEKEAHYELGNYMFTFAEYEDAVRHYTTVIELDPLHKLAYNELAYTYHEMGDFDKSIWAINKYISLAPDEANPYDTRGELFAYNGRVDQAIESFKRALEIKPDYYASLTDLGRMYLFKKDYAEAERCFRDLSSCDDKDTRVVGRTCLALIPLYQGRLDSALSVLDDAVAADRMERVKVQDSEPKHILKAFIHSEKGNLDASLKEIEISADAWVGISPVRRMGLLGCSVFFLAENGEVARAEEMARTLKGDFEQKAQGAMFIYWWSLGAIELAKGNPQGAASNLERAKEEMTSFRPNVFIDLARAYLELGKLDKAVSELEKVLTRYDSQRAFFAASVVKVHYFLGLAYQRSGWTDKAIEQYVEFLDIWKDADPGIEEIDDAKERLERLRAAS